MNRINPLPDERNSMQTITRDELKQKMEQNPGTTLIETLPEESYNEFHIPGAANIPINDQFDENVQQAVPHKNQDVVVYCMNSDCDASPKAAQRMEELGYSNVYDYEAGKQEWNQAGLPVEP